MHRWLLIAIVLVQTAAAQSGADLIFRAGFEPPAPDGRAEAGAFLWRVTYGPTQADIDAVETLGFEGWVDQQQAMAPTYHQPQLDDFGIEIGQGERQRVWFNVAQNAPDQFRQRAAFALSQILVVSDLNGDLEGQPLAVAQYYDLLVEHAFGNYRNLLEEVTLTPVMGHYLSMFRSTRDAVAGIEPDENYAREIIQLFSIGLVELNIDGTPRLNGGNLIPTYEQRHIVALAEAFTGWNFAGADQGDGDCEPWEWRWPEPNWLEPMAPCPVTNPNQNQPDNYHVTSAKTIVGDVVLPAGQTAEQDMQMALNTLFNHPNVGPFLAYRLIQRLVTSNPSPAYVARVASVFNNNGSGVRGDLGAVFKAIVMDGEALAGPTNNTTFGKLREPLFFQLQLNRVYRAQISQEFANNPDCCWPGAIYEPQRFYGQAALRSPSVFNFFKPDFAQPGPIESQGLVSPEFEISTETQVVMLANFFFDTLGWGAPIPWQTQHELQIGELEALAGNPSALVDRVDRDLLFGTLNATARQLIIDRVSDIRAQDADRRVAETIYYIITSPQSVVQR
ncbi:MAG: DUF1800 family protein [Pseudomonadota bacterium]